MRKYLRASVVFFLVAFQGCVISPSENLGKRTFGTKLDDNATESRAKKNIKSAHPDLEHANFNVTAFNGMLLLTGQVSSTETLELAAKAVQDLRNVKQVHNELVVSGPISFMARTNDSWLSTKVRTAMLFDDEIEGSRIKVITEDGVVYLMGLLTRDESETAVERTKKVFGVQKIVKVFEYLN